jgi:hypothetical protein
MKIVITIVKDSVSPETKKEVEAVLGTVAWLEFNPQMGMAPKIELFPSSSEAKA